MNTEAIRLLEEIKAIDSKVFALPQGSTQRVPLLAEAYPLRKELAMALKLSVDESMSKTTLFSQRTVPHLDGSAPCTRSVPVLARMAGPYEKYDVVRFVIGTGYKDDSNCWMLDDNRSLAAIDSWCYINMPAREGMVEYLR